MTHELITAPHRPDCDRLYSDMPFSVRSRLIYVASRTLTGCTISVPLEVALCFDGIYADVRDSDDS